MSINSRKQIKFGAIISYIALFLNIGLTLVYTPWMVARIGKANYGLYTLAISLIGVFLVDFGVSAAISRFVAKYRAEDNLEKANEFISCAFKLYIAIDAILLIVFTIVFFSLENIYHSLTPNELETFRIIFVIVAGFNLISFPMTPLSGIFNAFEEYIWLKVCDLVYKILIVVLVVLVLLGGYGVIAVVFANAVGGLITILLKIVVIKKKIPVKINLGKSEKWIYKELFSFSIWSTIIAVSQRLTYNLAPSILAITTGSIAVAYYSPASAINSYYYAVAVAINGLFLPTLSRYIANREEEKILPLMVKVGRYQTAILGLVFAGFFCIGKDFMILWMGRDFLESYYCTVLLMLPSLFEYSQQIGNTAIVAKNLVKYQAIWLIITSLVGCGVAFVTSKLWGATGSCIAICATGLFNVIGLNNIHHRKVGLNIFSFYRQCYGTMLLPIILTCVIGYAVLQLFTQCSYMWLLAKGGIVIGIYLLFLILLGMNKQERMYMFGFFKRIAKR